MSTLEQSSICMLVVALAVFAAMPGNALAAVTPSPPTATTTTTTTMTTTSAAETVTPSTMSTTNATSTTTSSSTSSSFAGDIWARYVLIPNSAINFAGTTYYVNYRVFRETSMTVVAEECLDDVTCVSFDYNRGENMGWAHRIPYQCTVSAGATFLNGTSPQTDFYQLKPAFHSFNASQCVLNPISADSSGAHVSALDIFLIILACILGGMFVSVFTSWVLGCSDSQRRAREQQFRAAGDDLRRRIARARAAEQRQHNDGGGGGRARHGPDEDEDDDDDNMQIGGQEQQGEADVMLGGGRIEEHVV